MKYLISGGGTGGHIFPAVSIADALKQLDPNAEILFVGADNRMEMQRVPQAGYPIVGLPIRGFNRSQPWKNISVLIDLFRSMRMAKKIIRDFQPDVAVGVGGYASGAAMKVAARMGIPVLIQEQNGFAGVTNKLLKNDARKICVAYEGMEKFFPKDKIILTGNPVRMNLTSGVRTLPKETKRLLVIGGSLGAKTINEAIAAHLPEIQAAGIDLVWQTGKNYIDLYRHLADTKQESGKGAAIHITDFLSDMPTQYANADLVISRAGASSISELCLLGKAAILVPSPNVAEDHQTHNAMALVNKNAAVLVKDADARDNLVSTAIALLNDPEHLRTLSANALKLAQPDAAQHIAKEVIALA